MIGPNTSKVGGKMTAYALFVQICRDEHKKRFPEELLEYKLFSRKCAERWKKMTEQERKWFKRMEAKDQERFEAESMSKKVKLDSSVGKKKIVNSIAEKPEKKENMTKAHAKEAKDQEKFEVKPLSKKVLCVASVAKTTNSGNGISEKPMPKVYKKIR